MANDGDDTNDPFIVSVRAPGDYALGHIPGAINIPWKTIVDVENLKKLPTDQPIVIYCYTGHTGGLATMALTKQQLEKMAKGKAPGDGGSAVIALAADQYRAAKRAKGYRKWRAT